MMSTRLMRLDPSNITARSAGEIWVAKGVAHPTRLTNPCSRWPVSWTFHVRQLTVLRDSNAGTWARR